MRSNTLRITGGLIAVTAVLAVLFVMIAPDHRVEAIKATWRRTNGDSGQECLDVWASSLKDPQTVQLLATTDRGDGMIKVKYRAKNSSGAYGTGFFDCPLKYGEVDKVAVILRRSEKVLERYRRTR